MIDGQGVLSSPWLLRSAAPVTPLVGTLASSMTALSPAAPRRFFARMQRRSAQAAEFFRMPGRGVVVLTTAVEL